MAFHELATNAVKYGALSAPAGRVKVEWSRDDRNLHVRWIESGGPAVTAPKKNGFGTRAVTRMVGQLNGQIDFHWQSGGLICQITLAM